MTLRHLNLADTPTDDDTHPVAVDEESATAGEEDGPSPATLTLPPYLVEAGDLLVDWPHARVGSLLSDGLWWWFYDADGVLICDPQPGDVDVQVVRATDDLAAGVGRHPAGGAR